MAPRKKEKAAPARSKGRPSNHNKEQLFGLLKPIDSAARAAPQAASKESVYRTSRLRRTRRTKLQVERLDQLIIDALQRDHPHSVRHVFYRMTNPRFPEHVPKDTGYPRGEKPGRGRADFCWLIFERGHTGRAEIDWLHRDRDDNTRKRRI
jgi:hypothetical protein